MAEDQLPAEGHLLHPMFYKMWEMKANHTWFNYEVYATTTKELEMCVWNGTHPVEKNTTRHLCPAGSRVRVWMVSRFGDAGVTDNLTNPKGYDIRGLDADKDLKDYEFKKIR